MDLLDCKLDELDCYWSKKGKYSQGLLEIIASLPTELAERDKIVVELCCADLEWRWRTIGNQLVANPGLGSLTQEGVDDSQQSSFLDHYATILDHAGGQPAEKQKLVLAEWRARSAWGDRPDIQAYSTAYSLNREPLESELDSLARMRLRVALGEQRLETAVPAQFAIGRQDVTEPAPPSWISESERLLVAPLSQTEVSRKQLAISRTRLREVEIANTSRNVVIILRNRRLAPGKAIRSPLPLEFDLGGASLLLSCNFLPG